MRTLTIVRHCERDHTGELSETGISQAEDLAQRIKGLIGGGPSIILTSPAPRARQTADIIRGQLGSTIKEEVDLNEGSDNSHIIAAFKVVETELKNQTFDNILIVTHQPISEGLASYLVRKKDQKLPPEAFELGRGWMIKIEPGTEPQAQPIII